MKVVYCVSYSISKALNQISASSFGQNVWMIQLPSDS